MSSKPPTQNYDPNVVGPFVGEIRALAVKALHGEDVSAAIAQSVQGAATQFAAWIHGTELGNLEFYLGQLRIAAEITHASQPQYKAALQEAAERAREILEAKKTSDGK